MRPRGRQMETSNNPNKVLCSPIYDIQLQAVEKKSIHRRPSTHSKGLPFQRSFNTTVVVPSMSSVEYRTLYLAAHASISLLLELASCSISSSWSFKMSALSTSRRTPSTRRNVSMELDAHAKDIIPIVIIPAPAKQRRPATNRLGTKVMR